MTGTVTSLGEVFAAWRLYVAGKAGGTLP